MVVVKTFELGGKKIRFTLKRRKWYVEKNGELIDTYSEKKGWYIVSFLEKLNQN